MSSNEPLRNRLPYVAPRIAQAALERARLTVVPRRRSTALRMPFIAFVTVILLGGVVGLLMFNTSMQQAAFRESALQRQATDLGVQQEALEQDIQKLNDGTRIAAGAEKQGMVIPTAPAAVLHLGSGRITGTPTPANAADRLPLRQPGPHKPASLNPGTVHVQGKPPVKAGTNGAPNRVR